jgi:hypothetical protein
MTCVKSFETIDVCFDVLIVYKCAICVDSLAFQGAINATDLCVYSYTPKIGDGYITALNLNVTPQKKLGLSTTREPTSC